MEVETSNTPSKAAKQTTNATEPKQRRPQPQTPTQIQPNGNAAKPPVQQKQPSVQPQLNPNNRPTSPPIKSTPQFQDPNSSRDRIPQLRAQPNTMSPSTPVQSSPASTMRQETNNNSGGTKEKVPMHPKQQTSNGGK